MHPDSSLPREDFFHLEVSMKLVSWNVNGLRACLGKGFLALLCAGKCRCDLPAGDEAPAGAGRLRAGRLSPLFLFRREKGLFRARRYSDEAGPAFRPIWAGPRRARPRRSAHHGGSTRNLYLVCCYTPNSQDGLKCAFPQHRMEREDALRAYLLRLDAEKPVVYCGDLNVAHEEIDIKNPKANPAERGLF